MSFHYARKWDLDQWPEGRIVGDSGAYSARMKGVTISVDDLGMWADRWRHRLFWVACLDVAGDQPRTRANWHAMNSTWNLQSIPSIHVGDDPRMLDYYADHGCDFVGLGGSAGGSASTPARMRWLISVFKYARDNHPTMRFHGWGMTGTVTQPLPFWSVDSTSWASSFRYGNVILRDPRTNKKRDYKTDGKDVYRPEISNLLRKHYDTNPTDVAVSNSSTRPQLIRISALAQMVYEEKMRRMHLPGIPAPTWGLMNSNGIDPTGPNVVLADSSQSNMTMLNPHMQKGTR